MFFHTDNTKNILDPKTFLVLIRFEFHTRRSSNPRYSLRAFAKFLSVDPSYLSKVINGKVPPSIRLIENVQKKLKLKKGSEEIEREKKEVFISEANYRSYSVQYFCNFGVNGCKKFQS
jgi:hypothetical protein